MKSQVLKEFTKSLVWQDLESELALELCTELESTTFIGDAAVDGEEAGRQ